jgi:hypothetical protein
MAGQPCDVTPACARDTGREIAAAVGGKRSRKSVERAAVGRGIPGMGEGSDPRGFCAISRARKSGGGIEAAPLTGFGPRTMGIAGFCVAARQVREAARRSPHPIAGLAFEKATLGQTGEQVCTRSREIR